MHPERSEGSSFAQSQITYGYNTTPPSPAGRGRERSERVRVIQANRLLPCILSQCSALRSSDLPAREGSSFTQYAIHAIPSNYLHEDPLLTLGIHNKKFSAGEHDTPVRRNLKSKICNQKFPSSPNSSPMPSKSSSGQAWRHSDRIQRSISGGRAWMPGAYASGWRTQASSAITWAASGGST